MSKHIHIHMHSARTADAGWNESDHSRSDNGQFWAGGSGHVLSKYPDHASASTNVKARHEGITGSGFKHEKTEGKPDDVRGQNHHFAHPDGSRAVITNKQDAVTGRHTVMSHINTMNQGKAKPGASLGERQAMLREMGSPRYSGRSQELDRIQSEHAKRTGQALSRHQAANMRAGIK